MAIRASSETEGGELMRKIDLGLVVSYAVIGVCLTIFWLALGYVVVRML